MMIMISQLRPTDTIILPTACQKTQHTSVISPPVPQKICSVTKSKELALTLPDINELWQATRLCTLDQSWFYDAVSITTGTDMEGVVLAYFKTPPQHYSRDAQDNDAKQPGRERYSAPSTTVRAGPGWRPYEETEWRRQTHLIRKKLITNRS
jgi:hypothetical protein